MFDTAEVYGIGKSELLLGRFLRQSSSFNKAQIATKFAPLPLPGRLNAKAVVSACSDSLDRLGSRNCLLYQLHWPSLLLDEAYLDGLALCFEKGYCAGVGVSNYSPSQLRKAHKMLAARGIPLATQQIQYSLLARSPETNGLLQTARELNITTLAYSPLAQGILTGKFTETSLPKGPRGQIAKRVLPKVKPLLDEMRRISAKEGKSLSQIALNWCIQQGVVPIPGARSVSQASDNCGAMGWSLSLEDIQRLNDLSKASKVDMTVPLQNK